MFWVRRFYERMLHKHAYRKWGLCIKVLLLINHYSERHRNDGQFSK